MKYVLSIMLSLILLGCGSKNENSKLDLNHSDFDNDSIETKFQKQGFSIRYPKVWEPESDSAALLCRIVDSSDSLVFNPNFVLTERRKFTGLDLESATNILLKEMEISEIYQFSKIVSIDDVLINGIPTVLIDIKFRYDGIDLGQTTALYDINDYIINLTCMGPNVPEKSYVEYRELFIPIIYSTKKLN